MVYSFQIVVLYYPHVPPSNTVRPRRVLWRWDDAHPSYTYLRRYTIKFFLKTVNLTYDTILIPFTHCILRCPRRTWRQRVLRSLNRL